MSLTHVRWDSWVPNAEQVDGKIGYRVDVQEDESRAPDIVSGDQGLYDRDHGVCLYRHAVQVALERTHFVKTLPHSGCGYIRPVRGYEPRTSCAYHSTGTDRPSLARSLPSFHER